ncbi:Sypl1 [Columba livia]|nr:Sypl1 [Columba livia]
MLIKTSSSNTPAFLTRRPLCKLEMIINGFPSPFSFEQEMLLAKSWFLLQLLMMKGNTFSPEMPLEEDAVNQSAGVLNTVVFSAPDPKRCGGTWTDVYLVGNFSSSVQFFVTLAVLAFLYCMAALVVYVGYKHVYQQNSKFPLTDLAVTAITAFLWLVGTFAWAKALADIKMSTGASVIPGIEACKAPGTTCRFASVTSMKTLNMSVRFKLHVCVLNHQMLTVSWLRRLRTEQTIMLGNLAMLCHTMLVWLPALLQTIRELSKDNP